MQSYIDKCLGRAMNNNHKVLSGQEVDVGGTGRYSNMCTLHLKASSLPRWVVSTTLMSGVQNCGRALVQMIEYIVFFFCSLAPPSYVHLASTWRHDECSQAFPYFAAFLLSLLLWTQMEDKSRGGLGTRLDQRYKWSEPHWVAVSYKCSNYGNNSVSGTTTQSKLASVGLT